MQIEGTVFNGPATFGVNVVLSAQGERQVVEMIAASGTPPRPAPELAVATGFVARFEYFGCLLHDRKNVDYIPFDDQATQIFLLSQTMPMDQIHERLEGEFDRESLRRFAGLCGSIGIMDAWGRFNGHFLPDLRTGASTLSAPTLVRLAVTNACTFRCAHCFVGAGNPYADELTTTEVRALVDELADIGCLRLSLGGGEPLVRRDLPAIVAHANRRGVSVSLSTNAVAATKETMASLAGLRFEEIAVSMDTPDPARHDAWRGGPGAFDAALRGIEQLRTLGAPLALRTLLRPDSVADLDALIALAERLDVRTIRFRQLLPAGNALVDTGQVPDRDRMNAAWRAIEAARAGTRVRLDIAQQAPRGGKRVFEGFGDESARLECYVDPRGTVTPSGLLKEALPEDSLREASLLKIWREGAAFQGLRALQGNALCRHCSHFKGCRGGSRDAAWLLAGNLHLADPNCLVAAAAIAGGADARLAGALALPATP